MSFEQSVIVGSMVAPAVIVLVVCIIALQVSRLSSIATDERPTATSAIAFGWWVAVLAALVMRQGWQWWPDDAWRQTLWPLLGWCIWAVTFSRTNPRIVALRWGVCSLLAGWTAMLAMPTGDAWADTLPLHRGWMMAILASVLINTFAIDQVAQRGGRRWCLLIAVAAMAGPLALAASTYASLAEWTLSIVVASLAVAVGGVISEKIPASIMATPTFAAAASLTAAGRFHSYVDYPLWLFAAILFGPALVACVDRTIANRSTTIRVTSAAILCSIFVALTVAKIIS